MTDSKEKTPPVPPFVQLIEVMTRATQASLDSTTRMADEVLQWRAWEWTLILFSARYYTTRATPRAAALADRDFLISQARAAGHGEEIVQHIERNYQNIIQWVELAKAYLAEQGADAADEHLM
jgi:thioredoxin-like negative regulator of GroEL